MEPDYLENEHGCKARIVADSMNSTGDRVTSFEVVTHRFTLAEWNTHCLFARNSASSRAIPFARQLEKFMSTPAYPVEWPSEKPGMSGGTALEGQDLKDAVDLWDEWRHATSDLLLSYLAFHPAPEHRLHKSLLNRLMEPGQWHTMLITAANFENFFDLRVSPHAQPEIRAAAMLMQELFKAKAPRQLNLGDWHLPYVRFNEVVEGTNITTHLGGALFEGRFDAREISSSRCAATSYETQWAEKGYTQEIERYTGLTLNGHWSPLEHVCTPWLANEQVVSIPDPDNGFSPTGHVRRLAALGKFPGFLQWRHVVEARQDINTYR